MVAIVIKFGNRHILVENVLHSLLGKPGRVHGKLTDKVSDNLIPDIYLRKDFVP